MTCGDASARCARQGAAQAPAAEKDQDQDEDKDQDQDQVLSLLYPCDEARRGLEMLAEASMQQFNSSV